MFDNFLQVSSSDFSVKYLHNKYLLYYISRRYNLSYMCLIHNTGISSDLQNCAVIVTAKNIYITIRYIAVLRQQLKMYVKDNYNFVCF